MKNTFAFCLLSSVLAASSFAEAVKRVDLSNYFVSTNYLNCVAQRTEKPMYSGGVLTATSRQTFDLAKPCAGGITFGEGLTNLAARVAAMDASGVHTALLSSFVQVWDLPEADAIDVARESNNDIARAMKAYPGRFEGAALLPIVAGSDTCVAAALAELERCVNDLGFKVWIAASNFGADHLYDEKFEPLLKRAEELGVAIYLQDAYPIEEPFAALDGQDDPNEWGFALNNGQDLMVTSMRMVMNGTFDRYPKLRVILPNLGEYLPFNLDRMSAFIEMDSASRQCVKTLYHYAATNKNFILTTSGVTNEIPFTCGKRVMGAGGLCFGTGWPFEDTKAQADAIAGFDLTDAERDGVWSLNAQTYVLARKPDYAEATGKDWLYNHAIAGKECPDEAKADSGADLFYVYPTLVGNEQIVIDGFRGIDDAAMRDTATNMSTAVGAYCNTARCFAEMMHVYAPFYRQATLDTATDCATNAPNVVVADANAKYLAKLCEGPAYGDITNALTTYFAKWNKGRKLVLAAHSQGSAVLRLVMENYFTLPENKEKAKRIICSYQIGFGIGQSSIDKITAANGMTFATKADDTNVIVSYNTMGESASGNSVLLPPDTLAINPLSWSRSTDLADKGLNLGALTNAIGKADIIVPHLYSAQVADTGFNRGEVVVCKELNGEVLPDDIFGNGSLHTKDYGAYWEDLHKNCYDRITAATGKAPVVGKPMDYADKKNWMRLGDKNKSKSTAKPFDIFYLYPTSTGSSEYVAPVDENMMETALGNYKKAVEPLESYANVYAPYYRQVSATGIMADPTVDGLQLNLARHVGKTDVFAALDYYFTNVNVNATRPFVLASHSQGSASFKNAFEQYFVGEKKAYLQKMIAAYTIGYTFPTDWCAKVGVTFATGAADTGVLLTWNAEGPNAPVCSNMLTKDPNGQAINPLNWKRDETYAPISENLGSFRDGKPVAGAADAQLKAARPGALVVTNQTGYACAPAVLFGEESYHFDDWGMFRENACANILDRGKDVNGYCKLCTTNFPAHLCVSNATVMLTDKSSYVAGLVGDTVWIQTNNLGIATMQLVPEKGYRLMFNGKEEKSVAPSISSINLQPNGEFLIPDNSFEKITVEWIQRKPDYAADDGKDWLFNHDIPAKRYEGEPAQDPGVDLFYFYPTAVYVSDDHCVDGVCDIDDEYLRSEKGALGAWNMTGKVFGDFTRVYAPYYRQTPVDVEMSFPRDGTGYDVITQYWYERAPYADVTNALTHYFTTINPNGKRPFVLAGHSHGAGMLVLAMEHFFKDNPKLLQKMVACYAIGMGVSDKWEEAVKGYAPIATNATDAGVYVFWNTEGPGTSEGMISGLWPTNHVAGVNPLTWTRTGEYAPASLNLGGWTADDSGAIKPGLYDASNNVAHGTVVCSSPDLVARYMDASWGFGEKSLHGRDYKIYWENLRANALQRIKTRKTKLGYPDYAQIPLAGTPIDYEDPYNWVTNTGTAKPLDVFYVYPTMMLEGDSTVVPVTDAMKGKAYTNAYLNAASAFADYANVLVPAYRQMNMAVPASALYPEPRDFIDYLKGLTPRTDIFAALDYYFTNLNVNAARPFILAGHSQGSSMLKIAFEDYFRSNDTRKGYLNKMVAAYPLGYSFAQDWFDVYYPDKKLAFATNATDKGVLISWNTEGPDATKRSFVIENGALVINPMNWSTNVNEWAGTAELSGMIQQRTATDFDYGDNTYALVTTNSTDYLPASSGFGEKSLHGKDWSLWYDPIKANGFTRYAAFAGLKEVSTNNIPTVADTTWKIETKNVGGTWTEAIKSPTGAYYVDGTPETRQARVTYTVNPEKAAARYVFPNDKTTAIFDLEYDKTADQWYQQKPMEKILEATKVIYNQRKPDYTKAKDWVLHPTLKPDEARDIAGEPSDDPGVDLIYVYGTVAMTNAETTVDGFADLDDKQMRGDEATHTGGVWGMIPGSVKAFSDYTRVYMPFYRQMTLCGATNVMAGAGMEGANKAFAEALQKGVAYEDLAAALDAYFEKWNQGRPFILAGCSQGAAMLRNMVQHYFTQSENKSKLDKLVACYGIAYGVTKDWADSVESATDGKIHFATNATERGVYVSWNTVGPDSKNIPNALVPQGAISINPLTWTTDGTPADVDKNYGSLTNAATGAIAAHLYDATVDTVNGVVVSTNLPASDYVQGLVWFGDKSLHTWEMSAWWENIRDNAFRRIETATGKRPRCGTPNDYSKDENWMVKPETADKAVDVFFLYPTTDVGLTPNLVAEIDDAMKAAAWDAYQQDTMGFWSYANMYAPYYRQASFLGLQAQSGVGGLKNFCSTHVVKTDVFAALDYYFTNLNASAERPYILVGHSQGSCNIKLILEEYMKDHADYKAKLVAAYAMGFAVEKSWCMKADIEFAEGESDTGVIMTWNCEGPDATHGPVNFLTEPDDGQAINPLNWKTDDTYAPIELNLGSVVTNAAGEYVWGEGNADAQLSPMAGVAYGFRPGALVVTNTTAAYSPAVLGYQSYHGNDGAFFQRNVGNNGFTRYAAFAGLVEVKTNDIPTVADTTWKVLADGAEASVSPVDGKYYAPDDATAVELVYSLDAAKTAEGLVFTNGETAISFPMKMEGGVWVSAATKAEIEAATKPAVKYIAPVYVDGVASNGIAYWTTNTVSTFTIVTSATSAVTWGAAGATNWYVVTKDVTIANRITCVGDVRLILTDGATLNAEAGITASTGTTKTPIDYLGFTIYAQSTDAATMGALVATSGGDDGAGIGGNSISGEEFAPGKNITINGGTVTATGSSTEDDGSAGIGGSVSGNGTNITINAGIVTATGGEGAAGIGGGSGGAGSDITINGGTVTAIGLYGAGIGGGILGAGSDITINDGTVFVCGVVAKVEGEEYFAPEVIGNGAASEDPASGVAIAPSAKVFFNLTGIKDYQNGEGTWTEPMAPMPEASDGFAIMTPATPVDRTLVGGIANWTAAKTFALTNAMTGATRPVCVGGGTILGEAKLKLTHADETLSLLGAVGIQVGDTAWAELADDVCAVVGTGDMWSYETAGASPLWGYRESITNLVVESGVTGIGTRFFENMWWLRDVSLGASVTNVGGRAFKKCYGLTNVTSVASGVLAIGDYVFSGCHSLQAMTFADTPTFGTESYSLQAAIYMDGDIPIIYPIPQLKVGEQATALRIKGKQKLGDSDWTDVTEMADEERKIYHFFKVVMP